MQAVQSIRGSRSFARARVGRIGTLAALLAALCASPGAFAAGAWNAIGPAGGTVNVLLTSPNSTSTLYAGTPENGIFLSTDAGLSWRAANNGLAPSTDLGRQSLYNVYAMATNGQYIFAATAAGIYYTSAGAPPSWALLAATASTTPISMLAYEPLTQRLLAASGQTDGTAQPGVYVATVDPLLTPSPTWDFSPLPEAPGNLVGTLALVPGASPAHVMVGVGSHVYTSSIDTASTALSWVDGDPNATLGSAGASSLLYSQDLNEAFACSGHEAFSSGNALDVTAASWQAMTIASTGPTPVNCHALTATPFTLAGPPLVLGTDQGAFVSTDSTNFLPTGSLGAGPAAYSFAILGADSGSPALFAGSGFGVASVNLASLAANASWTPRNGAASVALGGSNQRLNNANIVDTAVLGSKLYGAAVATQHQYLNVFVSPDGGATWAPTQIGSTLSTDEEILSLVADSAHGLLYAATTQGLLVYSPSSGHWTAVAASTLSGRIGAIALGTNVLFVGTDNGLYTVPLSASPSSASPAGLPGKVVRSLLVSGGHVYVGTVDAADDNNYVFWASEASAASGTATWAPFGVTSAGTDRITSMLVVSGNLLAATKGSLVLYATEGSGWSSANMSSDPAQQISDTFGVVNGLFSDGVSVYAATGNNGVFVSPVSTVLSWSAYSGADDTALPSMEVHTLRAYGTTLYAATRAGIASFTGVTDTTPVTPPSTSSGSSGGGGGGSSDLAFIGLLSLAAAWAWRGKRRG